jgi:hypothetical protein
VVKKFHRNDPPTGGFVAPDFNPRRKEKREKKR